jgi:hypothetical protein
MRALFATLPETFQGSVGRAWAVTTSFVIVVVSLLPTSVAEHKLQIVLGSVLTLSFALLVYRALAPKKFFADAIDVRDIHDMYELRVMHDSESIARRANRIARAHFGKHMGFSYEMYRKWRLRNRLIFAAFLNDSGTLLGFVDVFPLSDAAGIALMNGDCSEQDLDIDDILDEGTASECNYVHIASIVCCQRSDIAAATVEQAALSYIYHLYEPRAKRIYTAIPTTADGVRVLERLCFMKWISATVASTRKPVYVLRSESARANVRLRKIMASIQTRLNEDIGGGELRIQLPPRSRRRTRAGRIETPAGATS